MGETEELRITLQEHIKKSDEWQDAIIKMMQEYHEMVNERMDDLNPIIEGLNAGRIVWKLILGLLGFATAIMTLKQIIK